MKTEWDLDLPHITSTIIDTHGIDDMFSVERFVPKSILERLKQSCGYSDCSCGSNAAFSRICMIRSVYFWTIRRSMAMIPFSTSARHLSGSSIDMTLISFILSMHVDE
jgi:hypothetical protein